MFHILFFSFSIASVYIRSGGWNWPPASQFSIGRHWSRDQPLHHPSFAYGYFKPRASARSNAGAPAATKWSGWAI